MISVLVTIVALSCDVLGYDPNLHQASWCWIDPEAPNPLFWTFFTGKAWELTASVLTLGLYSAIKLHLFRHKVGLSAWLHIMPCSFQGSGVWGHLSAGMMMMIMMMMMMMRVVVVVVVVLVIVLVVLVVLVVVVVVLVLEVW